jgi:Ca2+-dependent lipid-binding protein
MHVIFKPLEAQLTRDIDAIGKMDPYIKIEVNNQIYKTDVCHNGGKNPKWDDSFSFPLGGDGSVKVSVWEKDTFSKDDLIGDATLNVFQLGSLGNQVEWFDIFYNGTVAGKVAAQVTRIQPGSGPHLVIRPIRAELTRDNDLFGKMDTFVELLVNGQEYHTAIAQKGGKTPAWNDSLVVPLNGDGAVRLIVWDKDDSHNDLVGEANLNLYQLAQQGPQQVIELLFKGKSAGKVFLQITPVGK